jgi:chemotaxis protein methyltransferase CheR
MSADQTQSTGGHRAPQSVASVAMLTDMAPHVFKLFQSLVYKSSGIFLADHKRSLLVRRLRARVRELEIESFLDYYRLVGNGDDGSELSMMLDLVSTNETRFFREPRQLEYLEREILPALSAAATEHTRRRTLRAWCTSCSTGEEPFTLAMLLSHHLPASEGWKTTVLATDISNRVLERARGATWPIRQVTDIPETYLKEFMLRGTGSNIGNMKAKGNLRAMIDFKRLNLHLDPMPAGPFDLILCRNVLIYFDTESKRRVIDRLYSVLAPDGFLLVGHAESLGGLDSRLRLVAPTIYARATAPSLFEGDGSRRGDWRTTPQATDPGSKDAESELEP